MSNQTLLTGSSSVASVKSAFAAAAPYLRDFEAAIRRGRLVICAQCRSFEFSDAPTEIGNCREYGVTSFPFVPFRCEGYARRQRKAA